MSYAHNFGHWVKNGAFLSFLFSSYFIFRLFRFLFHSVGRFALPSLCDRISSFSSRQILLMFHPSHARQTDFYAYNSHALPLHALSFVPLSLCCFNISKSLCWSIIWTAQHGSEFLIWLCKCLYVDVCCCYCCELLSSRLLLAIFIFCVLCWAEESEPKKKRYKLNRDHFPAFLLLRRFIRRFRFLLTAFCISLWVKRERNKRKSRTPHTQTLVREWDTKYA